MSDPVFSPDGKWMWTGEDWIPAPPSSAEGESSTTQISNSSNSNNQNTTTVQVNMPFSNIRPPNYDELEMNISISYYYRHIGAGLILLSLLMPYYFEILSGLFLIREGSLFEINPFDVIELISIDPALGFGILLIYLSALTPNIFLITSLLAISQLTRNKSTRSTGIFHLAYFVIVVALPLIAGISDGEIFLLTSVYGYGFWIGGISGIALLIPPSNLPVPIIDEERTENTSDEAETLNSQEQNPSLDSPTEGNSPSATQFDSNYPPMPSAPPSPQTSQVVNHSRRPLFDLITQRGFNIGEFEFFNNKMQTEEGRSLFYAHATANNMPIGTWEDFEQKMK